MANEFEKEMETIQIYVKVQDRKGRYANVKLTESILKNLNKNKRIIGLEVFDLAKSKKDESLGNIEVKNSKSSPSEFIKKFIG
ncbi:MAG: hypothetical protein AABW72_02950 [archaeon]